MRAGRKRQMRGKMAGTVRAGQRVEEQWQKGDLDRVPNRLSWWENPGFRFVPPAMTLAI